jgi:CubicO group peptidase (beta-lactamase class C family)
MNVVPRASLLAAILLLAAVSACSDAAPAPEPPVVMPVPAVEEPVAPPPPPVVREGFVVGDPAAEGIDDVALAKLVTKAKTQHSEALVVVKNGKLVYEEYFGKDDEPIVAMSASKSFTSLAYGFLLAEGKLASLDELVVKTLPGFASADPRKAKITYRHLLTQTSGIDTTRAGGTAGDIEANGLAVSCLFEPGTSWQYSNGGIDLLAALAGKLAGKPMDQYLNEKLFRPMGIADVTWVTDRKGVPLGAGEMLIRPLDMAKVGQALLDGGIWKTKQIVPASWPALSFAQSSTFEPLYGLLWWRDAKVTSVGLTTDMLAQWKTAGLAADTTTKLEPIVGRTYPDESALYDALYGALTAAEWAALNTLLNTANHLPYVRNLGIGAVEGYNAAGWLGQFLVLVPEKKLVAVRMRRARPADYDGGREVDGFPTFPPDAAAIAK